MRETVYVNTLYVHCYNIVYSNMVNVYSDSITVHYSPVDYCICCYWEMSTVTMLLLYVFHCVLEWVVVICVRMSAL